MALHVLVDSERVLKLIEEKGLTLQGLATKIQSTKKTLKKWLEKGEQDGMSVLMVMRIGRALDIEWRTLLKD